MNCSPLHFQMLDAPLIIKNYVSGDKACKYEAYLKEMINASQWFTHHFAQPFCSPENENHGECDVYSGDYGLDFKLIASKTALQAKSIHSFQIYRMLEGAYAFCGPKKSGNMMVTRLPQAIRGQTIEQLLAVRKNATKKQGIENDIGEFFDTLEVRKNLLLFFPYRFSFEQPGDLLTDIRCIVKLCHDDFGTTFDYRAMLYPSLDTFFVFLYDYYFVLCKWSESSLCFLEAIPVERSDTFQHLALTYCHNWSQKRDVYLRMIQEGKTEEEVEKEIDEEDRNLKNLLSDNSVQFSNAP